MVYKQDKLRFKSHTRKCNKFSTEMFIVESSDRVRYVCTMFACVLASFVIGHKFAES